MNVTIHSKYDSALEVKDVDLLSFIDYESHGPARTFGITSTFKGKALVVCSPNVAAVEVVA